MINQKIRHRKWVNEMASESYSDIRHVVRDLCMMNNKFMNYMLDDNIAAAQVLLRIILKNDKIKVREVRIQNFLQNLYGHSAQLDILAQDAEGNYFNVEVQRSDEGASVRRARFYSSALDTHFLKPNRDYAELPDSYVIFITENDVLQKNIPLSSFERKCNEDGMAFGDGSHIIYVNSKYQDNTALGRLMQDLYCTEPQKLHYHEFAERMEFLKYSKEGEEKMTDVIELYAENKAREAAKEAAREAALVAEKKTKEESARNFLKSGVSAEIIAGALGLPLEDVRFIAQQQNV